MDSAAQKIKQEDTRTANRKRKRARDEEDVLEQKKEKQGWKSRTTGKEMQRHLEKEEIVKQTKTMRGMDDK